MDKNAIKVPCCDGKYTVVIEPNGGLHALRHDETWRDLTGDKLVYCLAYELQEARATLLIQERLRAIIQVNDSDKMDAERWRHTLENIGTLGVVASSNSIHSCTSRRI